ncbi:MAG: hypothetical protein AAF789_10385 [Bacteroidota bacterium]
MRKLFFSISLLALIGYVNGQYWFGVKGGVNLIDHVYQDSFYEDTLFNVGVDLNYQFGLAASYSASDKYSVYGELQFERINKKVTDQLTDGALATTEMTNFFLTVPIMLRINFGYGAVRYYLNGGPRLSYWLAGKGSLSLEEFEEFAPAGRDEDNNALPVNYKIRFNSSNASPTNPNTAFVADPNRVQFGLAAGAGATFDLYNGNRLMADFRFNWVHSSMATNSDNDVNLEQVNYRENLEYYHNIATFSIGYFFEFDKRLRLKGKSSNELTKKKPKRNRARRPG